MEKKLGLTTINSCATMEISHRIADPLHCRGWAGHYDGHGGRKAFRFPILDQILVRMCDRIRLQLAHLPDLDHAQYGQLAGDFELESRTSRILFNDHGYSGYGSSALKM